MRLGYVDTSFLLAIALAEPGGEGLRGRLAEFDHLLSSNLLEAEFGAALKREGVEGGTDGALHWLDWVFPRQPLSDEIAEILEVGYVRGADVWHLACALWVHRQVGRVEFLTLDRRLGELARGLGLG